MRTHHGSASRANHLTLLVSFPNDDARWLVDAGFGGSLLQPIPLQEDTHYHAPFTIGLRQFDDGCWQFWERLGEDEFSFDFEDVPADERAMSGRCHYLQTSPESRFVQNFVCQLRRPDSHATLRGRVFTIVTNDGKRKRVLKSADELVATLGNEFGLIAPKAANVWGQICERHAQLQTKNSGPD